MQSTEPSSRLYNNLLFTSDVLDLLFDQMPMGIVILNPDYIILRYNKTWVAYFERYNPSVASFIKTGTGFFDLLPQARHGLEPLFRAALNGEVNHENALQIMTGDNLTYWNVVSAPLLHDAQINGIVVVGIDVTEQMQVQKKLQQAVHELQLAHETNEQQVQERTRELQTLIRLQQALTSSLNSNEVLHVIVREARRLTHTDVGAVFLPENNNLVLAALSSEAPLGVELGYCISLTDSITGTAFRLGQTQLVTDITQYAHVDPNAIRRAGLRSILAIPLLSGTRSIGVLSVGNKVAGILNSEDERLLNMMTPSAVIALENVRVYEQASETAIAAERGRLARDLHDSVTQTLFSASLTAEVLPRIWERNPQEGMLRLEKLRELTRGALAEMRTLLLELRPTALAEMSLSDLLRQLAEGIAGRTRIEIAVNVTDEYELPTEVKTAVYRIAQEALNNVGKHSKARSAHILLSSIDGEMSLMISDDGIGFDPSANRARHLGLRIMAERAESIKATLNIETSLQQGTLVSVLWSEEDM